MRGMAWILAVAFLLVAAALPAVAATSVGSAVCSGCHAEAGQAWRASHHAQAMQVATPDTVLGDFTAGRLEHHGQVTELLRRGANYLVRTAGADGRMREFRITHTLGVYPLQQLLVTMPDGRLQALGVAWDSRPRAQGGQRWFHLYPEGAPPPGEPTHWSGREQTWNFMCASCHTTGLRKGYDVEADRYASTWDELGVGCEACHGAGSDHVGWARRPSATRPPGLGFSRPVARLKPLVFAFLPGAARPIAQALGPAAAGQAAGEVCWGCHARRSELVETRDPHTPFLDRYSPSLIAPGLFQADGRIDGEVFEYGAWVQSAMHRAGVTCANCHDSHSLALKAPGNAVCSQCHLPAAYEGPQHHGQAAGSAATATPCVTCHMPTKTYMGVHVRHDHGMRVPQGPMLATLASDSAFVRASALAAPTAGLTPQALAQAAADPDALVRLGAARGLARLGPREAVAVGEPLLADAYRAVRIEAARQLAGTPATAWRDKASASRLEAAVAELLAAERLAADRPEALLNLAMVHTRLAQPAEAERLLRLALQRAPDFAPTYVNLADLYRQLGREAEGERLLRDAVVRAPGSGESAHALGLLLIRRGRVPESIAWLERAYRTSGQRPAFALVLALALAETARPDDAVQVLEATRRQHGDDPVLLRAQIQQETRRGRLQEARRLQQRLLLEQPGVLQR